jgi:hypothetical protein
MERYVGPKAHASSCTLGVVGPSGKRLASDVVETNSRALIEVLRGYYQLGVAEAQRSWESVGIAQSAVAAFHSLKDRSRNRR